MPTLAFVINQYEKVKAFIPEEFYSLSLHVNKCMFSWERERLFDLPVTTAIMLNCLQMKTCQVKSVKNVETHKRYRQLSLNSLHVESHCHCELLSSKNWPTYI